MNNTNITLYLLMKQYIQNMRNKDFILLIGSIIAFVLFVILMEGCTSTKHKRDKQTTKLDAIKYKCDHSAILKGVPDEWSAKNYPVKAFNKTITKYLKGKRDTITKHDTVTAKCPDGTVIKTPCPPTRTITIYDTVVIHDTTALESTAVTKLLNYTIDSLRNEVTISRLKTTEVDSKATNRLKSALWGWGLFIALLLGVIAYNWLKSQYARKVNAVKDLIS